MFSPVQLYRLKTTEYLSYVLYLTMNSVVKKAIHTYSTMIRATTGFDLTFFSYVVQSLVFGSDALRATRNVRFVSSTNVLMERMTKMSEITAVT